MSLTSLAPAKINLYLHITGRRPDGYHLLDSLVAFVDVADRLTLAPAQKFAFRLQGPMARFLEGEDPEKNLVTRAARLLGKELGKVPAFEITLEKTLPVASGIGGGSTDAATALLLMASFWGLAATDERLARIAAMLGQDIPCCLARETCYFEGIGDKTTQGPRLPATPVLLVNPMKTLPTPAVYKARQGAFQPEARLSEAEGLTSPEALARALSSRTNGLTDAAQSLEPELGIVLQELESTEQALLVRMSGSGATCFALYPTDEATARAAQKLQKAHPSWWIAPTRLPHKI